MYCINDICYRMYSNSKVSPKVLYVIQVLRVRNLIRRYWFLSIFEMDNFLDNNCVRNFRNNVKGYHTIIAFSVNSYQG